MTPHDDPDAPLAVRLLTLVGVGGGVSTLADSVLHSIPAGVLGAIVTLLGAAVLEMLRPILRAYGEKHARKIVRASVPPPPPTE
jgi:tetrahydromethanopterin S-methyltransferase subunit C